MKKVGMEKLQERKIKAKTGGKITKVKNPQRAQRPDATSSIKKPSLRHVEKERVQRKRVRRHKHSRGRSSLTLSPSGS